MRRAVLIPLLLLAPRVAEGQGLRLRVTDAESGTGIGLALVTLLRDGLPVADGLTRADGTRFFPADPEGRYAVRIERAGLEPVTTAEFAVPDTVLGIAAPSTPFAFERQGRSARECPADAGATATAGLRLQARAVIRAAELARDEGLEPIAIRRVVRTLERDGSQRGEQLVTGEELGVRLFRTAPAQDLARQGFTYTDTVTGLVAFLGPDLPWFTSAEFAASHCFAAVEGRGRTAGMTGLEFTPHDGSGTRLGGTVWFDVEAAQLRFIEFTLVGGEAAPPAPAGRIAFDRLPSGVWIARDWMLRTPILTQAGQLLGYREELGEALQVSARMLALADSIANSRRPPGRISGVVVDSLTGQPLAGAVVAVEPAGPAARTDSSGIFSIRAVPGGFHRLGIRHPLFDSLGTRVASRLVRVGADSSTHVVLGGPSLTALKGGACDDSLAVLTGLVSDVATGAPIDTARVTLSWIEITFKPFLPLIVNPVELVVETDSTGRYAACVPARLEITASAEAAGVRTGRVDVRPDERRLAILYLALDRTAMDTTVGNATIEGVVQYQDRTPIADATVLLTEPQRTVATDSAGRFRIPSIPGGTRVLDVRAMGHAPARAVVEARAGDTTTTQVFLRRVTQLDAIVVRASAGQTGRALRELEERRQRGIGYRLTPIELLGFRHARMDAVARALPFTTVRWTRGTPRILLGTRGGRMCEPNVFVDGNRTPADLLGELPASDVLAVEFFSREAEVPLRYRTPNDCGAILVWTREGTSAAAEARRR